MCGIPVITYVKRFLLSVFLFLVTLPVLNAQTNEVADEIYVDYQKYFNESLKALTVPQTFISKNVKELRDGAASLTDESPVADVNIQTLPGKTRLLRDEQIYATRKNCTFIIGKIRKKDFAGNVNFDLTGSAFAINEEGICVTNYHVLKGVISKNDSTAAKDSVYFIMAFDKKIYFIDEILAYSQNNDIAIFKVNTRSEKLKPVPLGKLAQVGATVYCISQPTGYFYYFSKGIVARNVTIASQQTAAGYNPNGSPPIRMEITADYGVGSSGGPVLDAYGNLVGMVDSTVPLGTTIQNTDGNNIYHQQIVIKDAIPIKALKGLLKK